eukprot:1810920-Prymnesium_polylepis.1
MASATVGAVVGSLALHDRAEEAHIRRELAAVNVDEGRIEVVHRRAIVVLHEQVIIVRVAVPLIHPQPLAHGVTVILHLLDDQQRVATEVVRCRAVVAVCLAVTIGRVGLDHGDLRQCVREGRQLVEVIAQHLRGSELNQE